MRMFDLRLSSTKRAATVRFGDEKDWATRFWQIDFPYKWLPVLLGLGLGILLALLISAQNWPVIFSLILAIPVAIIFSRYPLAGLLIWLCLAPLFVMAPNLGYLYVFWLLHRLMVPLTLIAALFPYLFRIKQEWPIQVGRAELAMAAFMGLGILSALLLSLRTETAFYKLYERFFVAYCLYLLVRLTTPGEKDLKLLVWVVVVVLLAQVVVGLLQNFAPGVLPEQWYTENAKVRTIGTFNHPTRYTTVLVFCMLLIYQAAMHWRSHVRWFLLSVFALGALMVFLSYSKGSWLGAILVLLGLLVIYPKSTLSLVIILIVLFVLFGAGLFADQMAYALERFYDDSTNTRMVTNVAMIRMVEARPFFGWGYGNLDSFLPQFVVRLDDYAVEEEFSSHHTYLTIMAEMGIVGFILYILPFAGWLVLTIRAWPQLPKRGFMGRSLVVLLWLTILKQIVSASTSDFAISQSGAFAVALSWTALGLIASLVYPYLHPVYDLTTQASSKDANHR